MTVYLKLICTLILLSSVLSSRRRSALFNPCLFNVYPKFYISENVYFDLSRFAFEQNSWSIRYSHSNYTEATLKFKFCLRQGLSGDLFCGNRSVYACIFSDTNYVVRNAGSRISGPLYKNGELQISIDNGEGDDVRFSVLVRLNCSDIEEDPKFVSYHDFGVMVLWNTPVGCPIDEKDPHNTCVISSSKGIKYDLRPMRHSVYHYKHGRAGHYRVNVCGKKKKDECNTVCECNEINEEIEEFGTISQLALTGAKNSDLEIRYLDNLDNIHAEVHFKCDRGGEPHVTRLSLQGHVHIYMNSIFACEPAPPHTIIQDVAQNSYNLSALYHNAHNYRLKGPTADLNYIFNLGGVVDHMPGIACGGAVCLWDSRNNLSVSLGYAQLEPVVNDEFVLLRFTGGDKCGAGPYVHQAVIKLLCKVPGTDPELEYIMHDCVHYILWETPSACYYKYFKGSECTVTEEMYGHLYDLKPLYNKTNNYIAASPINEKFYINICGSIVGRCGSVQSGVSVCWNNKAIGRTNTDPIYYNGGIELKMTGDACRKNGPNSSVTIEFLCEMNIHADDHNKIQLKTMNEFDCVFVFVMYTSTVCTSTLKKYTCFVSDSESGYEYDFKKLSRTNSNYVVKNTAKNSTTTFLLNVCQPVISGPDVMCPHEAMACIFSGPNSDDNRYMSIGKMSEHAFKINKEGRIELHYNEGTICMDDASSAYETSTVIEFICDHKAMDSLPVFDSEHKCEYRFIWFTPVACPLDSQEAIQKTSKIPERGGEHSLSKAVPNHFVKTEEKGNKAPLELTFSSDKSKAVVVSSEKEHVESRYAYEESEPEHSEDYMSHAVKLKDLPDCFVMDNHGGRIDLSTLMKRHWHVRVSPDKSIVFSVCHNLTSVKCNNNGDAGSCMNNVNIGLANNRLMYEPGQPGMPGKAILNYTGGDPCNSTHKYSTLLLFECDIEEEVPTFLTKTDECAIVIKFVTPFVCVLDCVANSIDMQISIDLSVFKSNTHNYHVKSGEDEYVINICRPLVATNHRSLCSDGAAVCKLGKQHEDFHSHMSLGYMNSGSPLVVEKAGSVWLHYIHGSRCPTKPSAFSSAIIHFICSTTEGFGHPTFKRVTAECEYYFDWHTSIVCSNRTDIFESDTCCIHDVNFTSVMNLSVFKESRREVRSLAGSVYTLELCRNNTKICNNSQICRNSGHAFVNYGSKPIASYDYARNAVHILYIGGECSLTAHFHASIWLKCNRTHSWSSPSIIKETECIVVFEWESQHFCYYPNTSTGTGALTLNDGSKESSTSSGSSGLLWIIMGLFALCMLSFAFGLWLMDHRNSRFRSLLRHYCTSTSPATSIRYSRGSEESSIL